MIYCVEDDANIRELIVYTLNATGLEAGGYDNGRSFFEAVQQQLPELVILDIMLPGEDGLSILNKLKLETKTKHIPVIMVTAKSAEYDKVIGLDSGADDYITKPFAMMEFIARVKAVLRRAAGPNQSSPGLVLKGLEVDDEKHLVRANGEAVVLTYKEFELLKYLLENKGIAMSRERLLEVIWGYEYEGETRTVDVHIRSLRQKLGECGKFIATVRGIGYKIEE